jgi:two-component system cell cycle sensor histidine kinase/response regulator CckA
LGDSTVYETLIHQVAANGYYRFRMLLGAAVLCGALGMLAPDTQMQLVLVTSGFSVSLLATALWCMAWRGKRKRQYRLAIIADFIDQDTFPSFVVSTDGLVESTNRAGQSIFAPSGGETLTRMLSKTFANPGGILFRLCEKPNWQDQLKGPYSQGRGTALLARNHAQNRILNQIFGVSRVIG